MKRTLSNLFTLLLTAGGVFVASYLTYRHFHPEFTAGCSAGPGSCEGVLKSAYSKLGPIPTALFGLGMYLLLLVSCVLRHKRIANLLTTPKTVEAPSGAEDGETNAIPTTSPNPLYASALAEVRRLDAVVCIVSVLGVGISWWLQYNALFVVEAFCKWCFSSAIMVTLIALISSIDYGVSDRELDGEQKLVVGVLSAIGVTMIAVYSPKLHDQWLFVTKKEYHEARSVKMVSFDKNKLLSSEVHIHGNRNAPLLLMEFADLQCPSCKQADTAMRDFGRRFGDDACFAFRHFPLAKHVFGYNAACAAEAAALQDKFWEMKDLIFDRQEEMEAPDFKVQTFVKWAGELGMDTDRFSKDYLSEAVHKRVARDQAAGTLADIQTTPTFFVVTENGVWKFEGMGTLAPALQNPQHEIHQGKNPALPAELRSKKGSS